MNINVSIHSHARNLIVANTAALLLLELMLFALSRIRHLVSPLAIVFFGTLIFLGLAADVVRWFWHGVRAAEVNDDFLTLNTGRKLTRIAIPRKAIRCTKISRLPGNRKTRLQMTKGHPVTISEIAFSHQDFSLFLAALEEWATQ
jgi:hypothetical protein